MTHPTPFDGLLEMLCSLRGAGCVLTDRQLQVQAVTANDVLGVKPEVGTVLTDTLPELLGMTETIAAVVGSGSRFDLPWINRPLSDGSTGYMNLVVHTDPDDSDIWVHWLLDTTAEGRIKARIHERMHAALLGG